MTHQPNIGLTYYKLLGRLVLGLSIRKAARLRSQGHGFLVGMLRRVATAA